MTHATAPTLSIENLSNLADRKHSQLLEKYPQYQSLFSDKVVPTIEPSPQTTVWKSAIEQLKPSLEITEVVRTELTAVFDKLSQSISDPTLLADDQLRLYLEQQLTDLLGISISSEIAQKKLPLFQGVIESIPHTTMVIDQTLNSHGQILEADLSPFRYELPTLSQLHPDHDFEQYSILYPCWLDEGFSNNPSGILKQYCATQFLLISPIQKRMVVAHCIGLQTPSYRYALAGSPEVIRQGRFWWPGSGGQFICFALSTPTATGLLYA